MFFDYAQNNSGGSYTYNHNAGISEHVIIEAANVDEANRRAEDIGLYFDGCESGYDCECCGDRWYQQYSDRNATDTPMVHGVKDASAGVVKAPTYYHTHTNGEPFAYIHYLDKTIVPVYYQKSETDTEQ